MPNSFNFSNPPFDRLSREQQQLVSASLNLCYYPKGAPVLEPEQHCEYLQIIHKGLIEERAALGEEVFAHYTHDDCFDIRALFSGQNKHAYICLEDAICYLLPKAIFLQLCKQNSEFSHYFQSNLTQQQQLLSQAAGNQQNLSEFILNKIDPSIVQSAIVVPGEASIAEVTRLMKMRNCDCALVANKQPPKEAVTLGMITGTDLLHACVLDERPLDSPVAPLAHYNLIKVKMGDFLFDAMLLMTRHKIERVAVFEHDKLCGVITLTQILGLLSTHSHILALRIAQAQDFNDLQQAALSLSELVSRLHSNGVKQVFISRLLSTLHEQLISKLFTLRVNKNLLANSCLVLLGAAGRSEMVLQGPLECALIIEDEFEWPEQEEQMDLFCQQLQLLGYAFGDTPITPSDVSWCKPYRQWLSDLDRQFTVSQAEKMRHLATLLDARPIAGNFSLGQNLQNDIFAYAALAPNFIRQFARPALQESSALNLFGKLKLNWDSLDIQRSGLQAIIHGVRVLALEQDVRSCSTLERIDELIHGGVLPPDLGESLQEALQLFYSLLLNQHLKQLSPRNQEREPAEEIQGGATALAHILDLSASSKGERDLLRHALHRVKKFKQYLERHFHLESS